jgi:hypothetical protein
MSLLESSFNGETSPPDGTVAAGVLFVSSLDVPRPHDHTSRDDIAMQTKGRILLVVISHHLGGAG